MTPMKHRTISAAVAAFTVTVASIVPALAGPVEEKIIQPPAPSSPWEFRIELYGWLTNLDGKVGAAGFFAIASICCNNGLTVAISVNAASIQFPVFRNCR